MYVTCNGNKIPPRVTPISELVYYTRLWNLFVVVLFILIKIKQIINVSNGSYFSQMSHVVKIISAYMIIKNNYLFLKKLKKKEITICKHVRKMLFKYKKCSKNMKKENAK